MIAETSFPHLELPWDGETSATVTLHEDTNKADVE